MARDFVSEAVIRISAKADTKKAAAEAKSALRDLVTGGLNPMKAATVAATTAAVGFVAATTAAVVAVKSSISAVTEASLKLDSFSTRLGVATDDLQTLAFAAEQSNITFEALAVGMQRMTRRVAEAAQGMGEAQGAIDELGLSAVQLQKMDAATQFRTILGALADVETQADRVRLAFKLFDTEGVGLIQTIEDGAGGLEAFEQQARDMGIVLDKDLIASTIEYKKESRLLGNVITAVQGVIAKEFLPVVTSATQRAVAFIRQITPQIETLSKEAAGFVKDLTENVRGFLDENGDDLVEVLELAKAVGGTTFDITVKAAEGLVEFLAFVNRTRKSQQEQLRDALSGPFANAADFSIATENLSTLEQQLRAYIIESNEAAAATDVYAHALEGSASGLDTRAAAQKTAADATERLAAAEASAAIAAELADKQTMGSVEQLHLLANAFRSVSANIKQYAEDRALATGDEVDTSTIRERVEAMGIPVKKLDEETEKAAENVGGHLRDLEKAFTGIGDIAVEQLGTRMVVASGTMLTALSQTFGRAIAMQENFKQSATRIWRSFVADVIASVVQLIGKLVIAAGLKAFLGLGNARAIDSLAGALVGLNNLTDVFAASGAEGRQTGGAVVGPGKIPGFGGGDVIPVLAERGEYIIRKEAVAALGEGFLEAVNATGTQNARETLRGAVASPFYSQALTDELGRLSGASGLQAGGMVMPEDDSEMAPMALGLQAGGFVPVIRRQEGGPVLPSDIIRPPTIEELAAKYKIQEQAKTRAVINWLNNTSSYYRLPEGYTSDLLHWQGRQGHIGGREAWLHEYGPVLLPGGVRIEHLRDFVEGLDAIMRVERDQNLSYTSFGIMEEAANRLRIDTPQSLHAVADKILDEWTPYVGNRRRDAPTIGFGTIEDTENALIPEGFGGRADLLSGPPRFGQPGGAPLEVGAPGGPFGVGAGGTRPRGVTFTPPAQANLSGGGTTNLYVTATTTLGGEAEAENLLTQIVNGISDMGVRLG